MVDAIRARGGQAELDAWFRDPPSDDRAVLVVEAPASFRVTVPVPALATGERRRQPPDRLGTVGLFHLLASRLDPATALRAAQQRRDDRMVTGRRSDGTTCVHLAISARGDDGPSRLVTALTAWAAAGTPGAATVTTTAGGDTGDGDVILVACDSPAAPAPRQLEGPVTLAMLRSEVVNAGLRAHVGSAAIRCATDGMLDDAGVVAALPIRFTHDPTSTGPLRRAIARQTSATRDACDARLAPRGIG